MVTALRHANTKVFNTSHVQAGTTSPSLLAVVAGTKYWNNEGASACQEHYVQLRSKRHGHNLTGASSYVLFSEQALAATQQGTCMLALQTEVEDARYIHSRRAFAADNLSFELDGVQVHVARNTYAKCRTIERARVSTSDLRLPL